MGTQRISSPGISSPDARRVALVAGIVAAVVVIWRSTVERGGTLEAIAPATALVAHALLIGAAAGVYIHSRLSSDAFVDSWDHNLTDWLVVGLTIGGVHGLLGAFLPSSPGLSAQGVDSWLLVSQVIATCLLTVITQASGRATLNGDPALVGFMGGLALTAATCVAISAAPGLRFTPSDTVFVQASLILSGLALAWAVLLHNGVSTWVRRRLALAAVALVCAQSAAHVDGATAAGAAILANAVGALVLCALGARLLRLALQRHQDQVFLLHSALMDVETAALQHRELLHEVGSTVAGIASASSVIKLRPELSGPPRDRLERMMEAEVARLARLMREREGIEPDLDVDVDQVLEPLVTSHQARGLKIAWTPGGQVARGNADDLAEVVNILLENAGRHGGSGRVTVSVSTDDDMVEIRCSDQGAGISPEVRDRLFESGARRHGSPGQGLGLAIAHRLMAQRGGSLEVVDETSGATFAARLPRIGPADAALDHAS